MQTRDDVDAWGKKEGSVGEEGEKDRGRRK